MARCDESPMTTQDMPHSSGRAPAPLTCPAPSQRAAAIPHASPTPFVCPSHDLTHVPRPPSMRPDAFLRAPPLPFLTRCHHPRCIPCTLHVPPISCSSLDIQWYFFLFTFYPSFPTIFFFCLLQLYLLNLTNITTTSLRTLTPSHGARQ